MKIVKLEAENVKAIKAVEIAPDGALVPITGKNGQGKSTVLDCIWWALAGTKHIQAKPIRDGQNKAHIRLDMGDLIVTRKFIKGGSNLTVENADGARYSSPQRMLDDLIGALSFDPLAFAGLPAKDQFEQLRSVLGLDFTDIDYRIDGVFEERADVNRDAKRARAAADAIKLEGEVPKNIRPADEIVADIEKAMDANNEIEQRRVRREQAQDTIGRNRQRIGELESQIKSLTTEADDLELALSKAGPLPDMVDVDALKAELAKSQSTSEWAKKAQLADEAASHEKQAAELTSKLEALRQSKADMIAAVDMPVNGLGFGDGVVTLDDIPFDQASTAQQLRTSVALAMAANPKLRVIRIKEGSLLDEDNMAVLAEMAETHDFQIWIEVVDSSGKLGVVIEDGQVVTASAEAA